MREAVASSGRTLRYLDPRSDAQIRLFCFPHAGGATSAFRDWLADIPQWIEPIGIQLPGRENRLAEPAYERMGPLAAEVAQDVATLLDLPAAFCGVSMGARVALAVARLLHERSKPLPLALFVAASAAPRSYSPVPGWDESDDKLIAYLRDLGGTAASVWDNPALMELQLPLVRADLTVVATCRPDEGGPIGVPIVGFAGADDPFCTAPQMLPWAAETSAGFELRTLPGGHFFPAQSRREMLRTVVETLTKAGLRSR